MPGRSHGQRSLAVYSPWGHKVGHNLAHTASLVMLVVKNLPADARYIRDVDLIPGLGRFPGGGHGNPLQYSGLENPYGQKSLAGYSPWGHKELDLTG